MATSAGGGSTPLFECDVVEPDGEVLVAVRGELDVRTVADLDECLEEVIARGKPVFLDLGATTFVDGRGMRLIVQTARSLGECGRRLTVATSSQLLHRLLLRAPGVRDLTVYVV